MFTEKQRAIMYAMMIAEIDCQLFNIDYLAEDSKGHGLCKMFYVITGETMNQYNMRRLLPELHTQRPTCWWNSSYWWKPGEWKKRRKALINAIKLIEK